MFHAKNPYQVNNYISIYYIESHASNGTDDSKQSSVNQPFIRHSTNCVAGKDITKKSGVNNFVENFGRLWKKMGKSLYFCHNQY